MPTLPQSQSNRRAAETRFVISNPWTSCLLPLALILSLLSLLSPYHPVLPLSTPRLFSILIKAKHFKVMKVMKPPACHCLPSTVHFLITGEVDWCIQLRPSKFSRRTFCTNYKVIILYSINCFQNMSHHSIGRARHIITTLHDLEEKNCAVTLCPPGLSWPPSQTLNYTHAWHETLKSCHTRNRIISTLAQEKS